MIWSTDYLNRLALEAEIEIAKELNCIVDRVSIASDIGLPIYKLPDYVYNIKRVFWKGYRIDPISHLDFPNSVQSFFEFGAGAFNPFGYNAAFQLGAIIAGRPSGKPTGYFYSKFGENTIILNPSPNESVNVLTGDLFNNTQNGFIVEFYRLPDGVTYKIPDYIRRRTIKNYVLYKAFAKEGIGQNLNASQYFKKRYIVALARAQRIVERLYSAQLYTISEPINPVFRNKPARPRLPDNYGIVVEDWEME